MRGPRIDLISASAGSGKTTRLSSLLADEVRGKRVRPAAVLGTTFTNKAAAELVQRVRQKLFQEGLVAEAQELEGARLGTVNSVCGRLASEFAFELGQSPELKVLDEKLAATRLEESLSEVVTLEEAAELTGLKARMLDFDWQAAVRQVMSAARANLVSPKELEACAKSSVSGLLRLFGPAAKNGDAFEAALRKALEKFCVAVEAAGPETAKAKKALDAAKDALQALRHGILPWATWLNLSNLDPGKAFADEATPLWEAAGKQDEHPRLHADLRRAVELSFDIAARALEAYGQRKREWGVIDFVDQEVMALRLLERDDVRERLRGELDLVLVDEFQDTSPLQLAIFVKLAALAKRSVWVGDQKQAIFGFRGTDPALMDAALEAVLKGGAPETLGQSWRSRPELVKLTSSVFAPPFATQGIPAGRVKLEPGRKTEPPGLGAVVEHWRLDADAAAGYVHALAEGVRQLLDDAKARVRDPESKAARPIRPGDIAVLCRANERCAQVAAALEAAGIRAAQTRAGLLATHEAQAALAGLRLFVDPGDGVAVAQLARVLHFPEDADGWLGALLSRKGRVPFEELEFHARVAEARRRHPAAGAVAALDAATEAIELRELCRRWGGALLSLANLDALRMLAEQYVAECAAQGFGATPAGLVAHLEGLAEDGLDEQAVVTGPDAVVVSTWHRAKGLEWPVVVLYDLEDDKEPMPLGVHVVANPRGFDFEDPLAGRSIRFWPTPYRVAHRKAPFHARLNQHPAKAAAQAEHERQELRLLYVGWTRARDRVVLATKGHSLDTPVLRRLSDQGRALLVEPSTGGEATWAGCSVKLGLRDASPAEPKPQEAKPDDGPPTRKPREYPPARVSPSALVGRGTVGKPVTIGKRTTLVGSPEMDRVGMAVHGFLGADRDELPARVRLGIAKGLLERWGVAAALKPEALVEMGDSLRTWVTTLAPDARWLRELPLTHRQPDGSQVRGTADLVLETKDGLHVVDHKSFPGSVDDALGRAAGYAGQLAAYVRALEATTAKPVLTCHVHLPIGGVMVPVLVES